MLALFFTFVAVMVLFPETPAARWLHRWLVQPVAAWLNRLSWMNLGLAVALFAGVGLMTLLFGAEGLRVFGMMAGEGMIWLTLFDATILIDLFVVGTVLAGVTRVRAMRDLALARLRTAGTAIIAVQRAGRQRTRRSRPTAAAKPRRTDGPDPFGLAYA